MANKPPNNRVDLLKDRNTKLGAQVEVQRKEIEGKRQEIRYDQEGIEILEDVGTRLDKKETYDVEDARTTVLELNRVHELMARSAAEKRALEIALHKALASDDFPNISEEPQVEVDFKPRKIQASQQREPVVHSAQGMVITEDAIKQKVQEILSDSQSQEKIELQVWDFDCIATCSLIASLF